MGTLEQSEERDVRSMECWIANAHWPIKRKDCAKQWYASFALQNRSTLCDANRKALQVLYICFDKPPKKNRKGQINRCIHKTFYNLFFIYMSHKASCNCQIGASIPLAGHIRLYLC